MTRDEAAIGLARWVKDQREGASLMEEALPAFYGENAAGVPALIEMAHRQIAAAEDALRAEGYGHLVD